MEWGVPVRKRVPKGLFFYGKIFSPYNLLS